MQGLYYYIIIVYMDMTTELFMDNFTSTAVIINIIQILVNILSGEEKLHVNDFAKYVWRVCACVRAYVCVIETHLCQQLEMYNIDI